MAVEKSLMFLEGHDIVYSFRARDASYEFLMVTRDRRDMINNFPEVAKYGVLVVDCPVMQGD